MDTCKRKNSGQIGSEHHKAKLNEDDIVKIREKHQEGAKQKDLAKEYGVNKTSIHHIVTRKSWRHVE
jgi:Mor family transcriptional regulator